VRIHPPDGGTTFLDHQPELFAAFNRVYGTLWSEGVLDQATKEAARLRNARVTGCNICRNLRFAGAREAGLTENLVDEIDDAYATSDLPHRYKLAVGYADVIINDPNGLGDDLRDAMLDEFTSEEIVELTLTTALALAFSKAAVAWGPPPDMPVLEIPTPTPDGSVT
jgi:AhpD family alkylhydroperoxidase